MLSYFCLFVCLFIHPLSLFNTRTGRTHTYLRLTIDMRFVTFLNARQMHFLALSLSFSFSLSISLCLPNCSSLHLSLFLSHSLVLFILYFLLNFFFFFFKSYIFFLFFFFQIRPRIADSYVKKNKKKHLYN